MRNEAVRRTEQKSSPLESRRYSTNTPAEAHWIKAEHQRTTRFNDDKKDQTDWTSTHKWSIQKDKNPPVKVEVLVQCSALRHSEGVQTEHEADVHFGLIAQVLTTELKAQTWSGCLYSSLPVQCRRSLWAQIQRHKIKKKSKTLGRQTQRRRGGDRQHDSGKLVQAKCECRENKPRAGNKVSIRVIPAARSERSVWCAAHSTGKRPPDPGWIEQLAGGSRWTTSDTFTAAVWVPLRSLTSSPACRTTNSLREPFPQHTYRFHQYM